MNQESQISRFHTKYVVAENGCWEWIGSLFSGGYGRYQCDGRPMNAHRAAYMLLIKKNIGNYYVLHRCDNRKCVNPSHLFLGTAKDNAVDRDKKGRSGWQRKSWRPWNYGIHNGVKLDRYGNWCDVIECAKCGKEILKTPRERKIYKNSFCSHSCTRSFYSNMAVSK